MVVHDGSWWFMVVYGGESFINSFFPMFFPRFPYPLQALTAAMELKGAAKAHIGLRRDVQFGKAPWRVAFAVEFAGLHWK